MTLPAAIVPTTTATMQTTVRTDLGEGVLCRFKARSGVSSRSDCTN